MTILIRMLILTLLWKKRRLPSLKCLAEKIAIFILFSCKNSIVAKAKILSNIFRIVHDNWRFKLAIQRVGLDYCWIIFVLRHCVCKSDVSHNQAVCVLNTMHVIARLLYMDWGNSCIIWQCQLRGARIDRVIKTIELTLIYELNLMRRIHFVAK